MQPPIFCALAPKGAFPVRQSDLRGLKRMAGTSSSQGRHFALPQGRYLRSSVRQRIIVVSRSETLRTGRYPFWVEAVTA
jgi:hypothetical protein